jgi:hypothetical protein
MESYFFEMLKKKIWAKKNNRTFSQKYGFGIRDPRSRKKTYPGSRIQGKKGTGSRIRIRNTGRKKTLLF